MYKFSFRFVSLNKIFEAVNKLSPKNTHRLMIDRSKLLKKIKTLLLFYVSFPFQQCIIKLLCSSWNEVC